MEAVAKLRNCPMSPRKMRMVVDVIRGKSVEEAEKIFNKFHELVTDKLGDNPDIDELGKLAVFGGVREFPARVKCASLAWHTMISALHNRNEKVVTE